MAEYKPRQYTSKTINYDTRIPTKNLDTRVKLYQPSKPIKDIPPTKTYDTKPPKNIKVRTYKMRTYDTYTEYVPPWSRGKEKVKRERPPPKPKRAKEKDDGEKEEEKEEAPEEKAPETKVTFAPLPVIVEDEASLQAVGSVKRMLDLFFV